MPLLGSKVPYFARCKKCVVNDLEYLGGRETPSYIISFCPFYKENRLILKEKINNILKRPLLIPLYLREILKNKATLPILLD